MRPVLSPVITSRLEKAAIDNGFDRECALVDGWLSFASTQCPMQIWLSAIGDDAYLVAVSQANVAFALSDHSVVPSIPLPQGAVACLGVLDIPALHHLVRRSFQLSKTLPDEPLHVFQRQTRSLPTTTEAERMVVQRIGQDVFRDALIEYWTGACAVTGIDLKPALRASHMKPWSECESDADRLNVFNGLLLVANLDALFDRGLISFENSGRILISSHVSVQCQDQLHLTSSMRVRWLSGQHLPYLTWHREHLFEKANVRGGLKR
jgi:putative restriction endonuclease